jgi:hypothetical protein
METGFRAQFDDEMLIRCRKLYFTYEYPQWRYVYRNRQQCRCDQKLSW